MFVRNSLMPPDSFTQYFKEEKELLVQICALNLIKGKCLGGGKLPLCPHSLC